MFISHQILRIRTWWRYTPRLTTNIFYDLFLPKRLDFERIFPQIVGCRIWPSSFLLLTDGDWNLRNHAARQTCTVFVFCRFSFLIWVCVCVALVWKSDEYVRPVRIALVRRLTLAVKGRHRHPVHDPTDTPNGISLSLSIHSNIGLSVYLWRPTLCYQLDRKLVARFGLHNLSCTHRRCGRSPALSCVCFCLPLLLRLFPFWRPFCPLPHSASALVSKVESNWMPLRPNFESSGREKQPLHSSSDCQISHYNATEELFIIFQKIDTFRWFHISLQCHSCMSVYGLVIIVWRRPITHTMNSHWLW